MAEGRNITEDRNITEGALVLEGGSLRCVFTAGVLDVLTEQGIALSYVNGVSAGTMAGMNYVSRQAGRMLQINEEYLHDKRYMSLRKLFKNRLAFNFDFVFGELSRDLIPYDYQTFYATPQKFEVAVTRCKTGKTEFFEKSCCPDMMKAVEASCSMPLLSRMVTVDHKKYLDGGIALPIAYERAMELGYDKIVLILTRHRGYRKPPIDRWTKLAYGHYFKPLPHLLKALYEVPNRYNRMQEELERLEDEGRIFVLRPQGPVAVSRMERDIRKLRALHSEGRAVATENLEALKAYLKL